MFKNSNPRTFTLFLCLMSAFSCASTPMKWEGSLNKQIDAYMESFDDYRKKVCESSTEKTFQENLKAWRGQGYWIPELHEDVDVESIKSLLPEMEKKLAWIKEQKVKVKKKGVPKENVTKPIHALLDQLLNLKKNELDASEEKKTASRKASLKLLEKLLKEYEVLIKKVSFFSSYKYPVDHLKNRKVHDSYREKDDEESEKRANYAFLYRKLQEDGSYLKDHTSYDVYLRTTIDTLHFELKQYDFYLSEDARYDIDYVLSKIESELAKGKDRVLERLTEWEERMQRTYDFYRSLTLPENQVPAIAGDKTSTPNRQLIKEHNKATLVLKGFVYKKQAEVYKYWHGKSELTRAIFVLETILMNEVGAVDGEDALERMDVARVVMNRLDKPKYLTIGKKEFLYPHLRALMTEADIKHEKWLNALFKQGEFSFSYYYMSGVSNIFCPDMAPRAKKLRKKNVEIALQVLKEGPTPFKATRYFSRASMIGRIHMDSIWEDYIPYPERPGLLAEGQEGLLKFLNEGKYTYLYAFKDPEESLYQVVEIDRKNYALGEKNGIKLFFNHRNPHYFRYFTKTETHTK